MPSPGRTPAFNEAGEIQSSPREPYALLAHWLRKTPAEVLAKKREEADFLFRRVGITFAVYGDTAGIERLIPFDILPRIFSWSEWQKLSLGLMQRVRALNLFLADVYGKREILAAGKIPQDLIFSGSGYCAAAENMTLPHSAWAHVAGIDLVRTGEEEFYVLEDNLRSPSGVSYMLEGREVSMRLLSEIFSAARIAPIEHYPELLLQTLLASAPEGVFKPRVVVLTPGIYNSAYFEHALLARLMGVDLVEGQDLFVHDAKVYMRTTSGPQEVHVIYRRIGDDFLDPMVFRRDSLLGVPGLVEAWRRGNVGLANALGTGVADNKAIYAYVPEMIRFYLGEEPLLANVPTYLLRRKEDLSYALAHLEDLVVKEVEGAGGYGMLIGPQASAQEIETFRQRILAHPEHYIAQPTLALSACPTVTETGISPRHVDLRPFVLSGKTVGLVPGGLTRVAMQEGSLVVNSSQGGGTKDTWVLM